MSDTDRRSELMSELERLRAKVAAVEALVRDEKRHLVRWIDGSRLVDVANVHAALASAGDDEDNEPKPWRCECCGSKRWVSWASGPDTPRRAQCVPCGRVQRMPEGDVLETKP